jgi:hypothetical protein
VPSKKVNKTAAHEILDHGSVAMEQHHTGGGRIAALNVVETDAIALGEHSNRRVPAFRHLREYDVADDEEDQHQSDDNENGFTSHHTLSLDMLAQPNSGSRNAE